MVYGCVLISSAAIANEQQNAVTHQSKTDSQGTLENSYTALNLSAESGESTLDLSHKSDWSYELDLNEIVYIEDDVEVDLGFDTSDYLPRRFQPL